MYKRKINDISDNVTEADLYIQSLLCIKIFTEYFFCSVKFNMES